MAFLGLDTSTRFLGVAICSGGRILAKSSLQSTAPGSTTLLPAIRMSLTAAGIDLADLRGIGVTSGPGQFTGLRVGMATAIGLGLGMEMPVRGFSTLLVLAEALASEETRTESFQVCALLGAGRGQLYRGIFSVRRQTDAVWLSSLQGNEDLCDPGKALEGLRSPALIGGEGYLNHRDLIDPHLSDNLKAVETTPELAPVLAARMERLANANALGEPEPLVPNYIRPPDAVQKRIR
jgi:tRNA threonylcarbamoyladenosine biosynthesis protein TsaB